MTEPRPSEAGSLLGEPAGNSGGPPVLPPDVGRLAETSRVTSWAAPLVSANVTRCGVSCGAVNCVVLLAAPLSRVKIGPPVLILMMPSYRVRPPWVARVRIFIK